MPKIRFETDAGWTMRCGRCAKILPDETLSFCPSCGIPFSRVPPTNSYSLIKERAEVMTHRRYQFKLGLGGMVGLGSLLLIFFGLAQIELKQRIRAIRVERELRIYTYDLPEFPALNAENRRLGIAIALQSFADHFGIALRDVQIHEDQFPDELKSIFGHPWKSEFSNLSFWEKVLLNKFLPHSGTSLDQPLPVIVTNVPLIVDQEASPDMETRHLSSSGLISGVGSPAFVLVSTFRMLDKSSDFASARPELRNSFDEAHYLGEYLLAHELGHALLGLADYVTAEESVRGPASVDDSTYRCLMHTDEGGGAKAWRDMRDRPLGSKSPCQKYSATLGAFAARERSIELLRDGHRADAERLHLAALDKIRETTNPWMAQLVRREQKLFLSTFKYWWPSDSMIQSKDDRL